MKPTPFAALALLVLGAPLHAAPPDIETLAAPVDAQVLSWRRDFHQHPELGNRETRTAGIVAAHLRALGLEVRTGVAHTGVVGILRGGQPGPNIALRADMDALPVTERVDLPFASKVTTELGGQTVGVMHACGHDAHTAMLMGVAAALTGMREQLPGAVMFVFQPAEEGPPPGEQGGARLMLDQGVFADFKPAAVFGLHVIAGIPSDSIRLRPGPLMAAADSFRIVVKGSQTHGSTPWRGVDPILAAADIISSAQSVVSRRAELTRAPLVLSFGIVQGGIRFNIIPDSVELTGTIRSFEQDMRESAHSDLRNVAEHVAAAHGATVETQIPQLEGAPVLRNDPALTAAMWPSLERAAPGRVEQTAPVTIAEDFAYFSEAAPVLFWFVGASAPDADMAAVPFNHSPDFTLDEAALKLGVRSMLQVALDRLAAAAQ
jgi:amidohydrolase